METFELQGREFIELNNLLKITGLCESGGRAKVLISEGQVKVDDTVELRKRCKIKKGQVVEFNSQKVKVS
ncbi:MAG: RNA-binding S4 domain-containing protein [Gammaproteobacteria bacterium]|nr:RNA-binding S4 domain-containing protein [Gammaproteobacteria bacterium]